MKAIPQEQLAAKDLKKLLKSSGKKVRIENKFITEIVTMLSHNGITSVHLVYLIS